MTVYKCTPKFRMGRLVVTAGAIIALTPDDISRAIARHVSGDWGNLDEHDRKRNDESLEFGGRFFSQYFAQDGTKFWIVTECDRSVTTILLPREY
jgi:hypothetical protein